MSIIEMIDMARAVAASGERNPSAIAKAIDCHFYSAWNAIIWVRQQTAATTTPPSPKEQAP